MGLFSSIAKAVAGPIIGGILGKEGQESANEASAASAQKQMDFQERMSNTAYQRGMVDMRKAGLNPMLAFMKGGASVPDGARYEAKNEMANLGEGLTRVNFEQQENIEASTALQLANAEKAKAEAEAARASAAEAMSRIPMHGSQYELNKRLADQSGYYYNVLMAEFDLKSKQSDLTAEEIKNAKERGLNLIKEGNWMELRQFAHEMELPGLQAKMASDMSAYGQNVRPYLKDAESVVNTAKDVATPFGAYYGSKAVGGILNSGKAANRGRPYINLRRYQNED